MFLFISAATVHGQAPKVKARVAGLEKDSVYMRLLTQEAALLAKEDSIVKITSAMRAGFRDNPDLRQQYSNQILQLEDQLFDIRNQSGEISGRINSIEQEWVVNNLGRHIDRYENEPDVPVYNGSAGFWDNTFFKSQLAAADYASLLAAQKRERQVADMLNAYRNNYVTISILEEQYRLAPTVELADSISGKYKVVSGINNRIADSLASVWNSIFDNKTYVYNYLLYKTNRTAQLTEAEKLTTNMKVTEAGLKGKTASDAVAFYPLEKNVLIFYETTIAGIVGSERTVDSLRNIQAAIARLRFDLPKITLTEKVFIQYENIGFSTRPKYTAQNPIPKTKVYATGSVYRLLLGTFAKAQQPSIFRGAYPLSYMIAPNNYYRYFAGGYATIEEAQKAQKTLKEKGFKNPEIVLWVGGQYSNISEVGSAMPTVPKEDVGKLFRVEISTTMNDLPAQTKQAVQQLLGSHDIARVAGPEDQSGLTTYTFIISSFDTRGLAENVASAVTRSDPALRVSIVEIEK